MPCLPQPQCVPIPLQTIPCERNNGCCQRTYVPLVLAYARTTHRFQGLTAGPVDPGKVKNMFDVIVCDPDEGLYEKSALGLLYTAVSRATTLGDEQGLNSAVYFTGSDFNEQRIRGIGRCTDGISEYKRVLDRRTWVRYLHDRTRTSAFSKQDIVTMLEWGTKYRTTYTLLYNRIRYFVHSKSQPSAPRDDFHIIGTENSSKPPPKKRKK